MIRRGGTCVRQEADGMVSWITRTFWLAAASLSVVPTGLAAAAAPDPAQVDQLFAPWNKPDTPGAALVVVRDGRIVLRRGYGQANLEYGVPNTTTTVFHAASVSKQFTAYAIHLLAQEGKLSLDDPVRQHLPELQVEAPTPITIRHLLLHTSGLRDQWELLGLAGLRMDDVITDNDLHGLIFQQRQLNFAPGEDSLYSNSGYSLLALIVRRVSGQTLAAFARQRIFEPLGMKNTRFQEFYGALVQGRAYSYARLRDGGYRYVALSFSNTGATSLFTTAEDLALWNGNFDAPRAGSAAAVAALLTSGRLNDGRDLRYGGGVGLGNYRGLPVVDHSGSDAGFRSYFLRLPQQKLAFVLLANAAEVNAVDLVQRVADLYLQDAPGVQPRKAVLPDQQVPPRDAAAYLGDYQVQPGRLVSIVAEGGRLFAQVPRQSRTALFPAGPLQLADRTADLTLTFAGSTGNDPSPSALWKLGERELKLTRLPVETPSAEQLRACAGDYYSEELRTLYTLEVRDGVLVVRYPRGVVGLRAINRNVFVALDYPLGTVVMHRNAAGACEGLDVTTGRVRNLKFQRVKLARVE
jgi:CubicO group peptidase (beta-lactamase class C family)